MNRAQQEMAGAKDDIGCCGSCMAFMLKFFNLFILGLGLGILAYGIYMAIKFTGLSIFTISVMSFGFLNALMSSLTFCCSRSSIFVTFYLVVMAVVAVAEIIAAFVFSIPASKQKVIDAMDDHVEGRLKSEIHDHVTYFGYVLYGIALVQALAWFTAYTLANQLQEGFDPNDSSYSKYTDPNTSLLRDAEAGKGGGTSGADDLMPSAGRSTYRDGKRAIDQKYAEKRAARAARRQQKS